MSAFQNQTEEGQPSISRHPLQRRDFIKLAAGAVATGIIGIPLPALAAAKLEPLPPGIKVSLQISTDATDEDLQFAQQLGVAYVNIPTGGRKATLENFIRLKKKVEAAGLKVWNIGNSNVHNMQEVTLNLPGRDKKIEEYKTLHGNFAVLRTLTRQEVCREDRANVEARLRSVRQPTLLIWGRDDPAWTFETQALGFLDCLQKPTLIVIPQCGHHPHEEKPQQTAEALRKWLMESQ